MSSARVTWRVLLPAWGYCVNSKTRCSKGFHHRNSPWLEECRDVHVLNRPGAVEPRHTSTEG